MFLGIYAYLPGCSIFWHIIGHSSLIEENIEGKFFDIGLSDEFLDFKPKIKTTKLKISK